MTKVKEKKEEKVTKPQNTEKENKAVKKAEKKKEKLENAKALSELSTAQDKIKITRDNKVENVLDSVNTPNSSSKLIFENDEFNEKEKAEEIEYESIYEDKEDKKKLTNLYIASFIIYIVLAATIYLLITTAIVPAINSKKIKKEQEQVEKLRIKNEKEDEKKKQKELEKQKREEETNRQKAAQDVIEQHDELDTSANAGDSEENVEDNTMNQEAGDGPTNQEENVPEIDSKKEKTNDTNTRNVDNGAASIEGMLNF